MRRLWTTLVSNCPKMMNWVEMASNDIGMPDWTSEEMVVADLGNTYAEDMAYLIFLMVQKCRWKLLM